MKDLGRFPLVMGIVNVTPDSFSGDGVLDESDFALTAAHLARDMIADGADIIDVGGESSRPGAQRISAEEEIRRVVPAIAAIRKIAPKIPIAVDTVKASVAEAACNAGATIINDISALGDSAMTELAAKRGVYVVLMHNRTDGTTSERQIGGEYKAPKYRDVVEDVIKALNARIAVAKAAGIKPGKIIVDPGIGFGKTPEQNCVLINNTGTIEKMTRCPVLIGPSRKSFISRILDTPPAERLEGTAAAVSAAVMRGAAIVRVHDVKFMSRIVRMTQAIAKR